METESYRLVAIQSILLAAIVQNGWHNNDCYKYLLKRICTHKMLSSDLQLLQLSNYVIKTFALYSIG